MHFSLKNYNHEFIRSIFKGALSLVYPSECPWCQEFDKNSCDECLLQWSEKTITRVLSSIPIYSTIPYDHRSSEIILRAKENRERSSRRFVVEAISSTLNRMVFPEGVVLVPIPASRRSMRRRGEDFIERIAKEALLLSRCKGEVVNLLSYNRSVKDQTKLTLKQREVNLKDAFSVKGKELAKLAQARAPLVIVDDVITTGATLRAAISAISESALGSERIAAGITAACSP